MQTFLARFASEIKGVLSGFDRLRLRGTIRWLASPRGLGTFMNSHRILLKDFKGWAQGLTDRIHRATEELAEHCGRPLLYLRDGRERKETRAGKIAAEDGVTEGLVTVFKCVEPCHTFTVGPNARTKRLELRHGPGKCSHYYFYVRDPQYGPLSVRLQAWLPFTVHVCLNGREWLAQELAARDVGFEQRDNCFVDVADLRLAQELLDRQLRTNWSGLLDRLLGRWHPSHAELFPQPLSYYWSGEETEWATDVLFRSREKLQRVYPHFLRQAATTFGSGDVLRFLGQSPTGRVHPCLRKEVLTSLKARPEGTRVKHALGRNTLKMYDKQGQVLRVETTINNPREMKVWRTKEGDPQGPKRRQRLRKGVADLHGRAELSDRSNGRYLESLAALQTPEALGEVAGKVCRPVRCRGGRVRSLEPLGKDQELLAAVSRGEFAVNGFRNRDLRELLVGADPLDKGEAKRQTARITRQLRLLCGHGLIRRMKGTHRYQLTRSGRTIITALRVAQQTSVQQLVELAA
jgi:hypothetical protein